MSVFLLVAYVLWSIIGFGILLIVNGEANGKLSLLKSWKTITCSICLGFITTFILLIEVISKYVSAERFIGFFKKVFDTDE